MIDKTSPIPIYYQLESYIKNQIEAGFILPGENIPSEREYAENYGISRMTVRQAINSLVNEGLLYRKKGSGTFVSEKKIEQPLQGLTSFTEDMQKRGMTPTSKLIHFEVIPANSFIANELKISEYAPVYEIKRIRLADGEPMALETNYLSANLVKGLTEEKVKASIYSYVEEKLGLRITHAEQMIESVRATDDHEKLLNIEKNHPMLYIQRNTFLHDGTPLELVRSVYRGDRYKFQIKMERN
ncbi:phosphonate metabolism transcriptional regulator PhnF [Sutcliffiella horikoshii]|uniref:Phosphonate metabolism transcriptional regulator PhnF n=1 Tax=Sutcliffiella horikoshii TaxID=79883 RepID=A0ABN4ZFZ6_9BACI|nr:GntR family transcriptional regulator [Sutcliffiella horikoshii]ART76119.1 phosphonate metabolism transcriptional regulator PhnF [Sutcliffiella horikoshii]